MEFTRRTIDLLGRAAFDLGRRAVLVLGVSEASERASERDQLASWRFLDPLKGGSAHGCAHERPSSRSTAERRPSKGTGVAPRPVSAVSPRLFWVFGSRVVATG